MNLTQEQLDQGKKVIIGYWITVFIAAIFFFETTIGYYYVVGGGLIFFAHVLETFIFGSVLKEHSDNVMKDKLLMLPYGFMVPAELKLKKGGDSN